MAGEAWRDERPVRGVWGPTLPRCSGQACFPGEAWPSVIACYTSPFATGVEFQHSGRTWFPSPTTVFSGYIGSLRNLLGITTPHSNLSYPPIYTLTCEHYCGTSSFLPTLWWDPAVSLLNTSCREFKPRDYRWIWG